MILNGKKFKDLVLLALSQRLELAAWTLLMR